MFVTGWFDVIHNAGVGKIREYAGILYAHDDEGVEQAIAQGRLKRILADWSPIRPGLFLCYPNRRHTRPVLRAFVDCLPDRDLLAIRQGAQT